MALEVFEVKNMKTGIIHTVPEGHFSLTDPSYELVQKPLEEPLVEPEVPSKKAVKKPRGRPKKSTTKASKAASVNIED